MKGLIISLAITIQLCLCDILTIPLSKKQGDKDHIIRRARLLSNETDPYSITTLTNSLQFMYYGDIQVGLIKQTFSVLFDTGSNQLWLPSYQCVKQSTNCPGFNNYYKCSSADGCTQSPSTKSYNITYGKGSVSGQFVKTSVGVCDLQQIQQSVLLVDQTESFTNLQSDGLLGLGVYDSSNPQQNAFVYNLKQAGIIKEMMFSFYLGFGRSDSQLIFGGFNPSKLANVSQIYYHNVVKDRIQSDNQRWGIETKSIQFKGFNYNLNYRQNIALVDSGTSLIALQDRIYKQFINFLTENYSFTKSWDQFYYTSCDTELPDLKFILTDSTGIDRVYALPSSFYLLKNSGTCILGISSLPSGISDVQIILGDVFMRRFVSIFTHSNFTVGLSQSIADPSDDYQYKLEVWAIILIVAGGLLVALIVAYCLYKKAKERRDRNRNYLNQQLNSVYFQGQGIRIGGQSEQYSVNNQISNQDIVYGQPIVPNYQNQQPQN